MTITDRRRQPHPTASLGITVTQSVREGLRIIHAGGLPCPTCGHMAKDGPSLRAIARLTGTSAPTLSRFLSGSEITSDILDRLYEFVNARLPEVPR